METFEFPLLKQSIFPPLQIFHITTPLEVDFSSVQGSVVYWLNDSWCILSCDVIEKLVTNKGITSTVFISKLQSQNLRPGSSVASCCPQTQHIFKWSLSIVLGRSSLILYWRRRNGQVRDIWDMWPLKGIHAWTSNVTSPLASCVSSVH